MKTRYFKSNSDYFKFIKKYKEKYEVLKVDILKNKIRVRYLKV